LFPPEIDLGSTAQFGKSDLQAIFRQGDGRKTQEYLLYFKFFALSSGGKGPQSAADDIVRCCLCRPVFQDGYVSGWAGRIGSYPEVPNFSVSKLSGRFCLRLANEPILGPKIKKSC
jgi:hypothetical protein